MIYLKYNICNNIYVFTVTDLMQPHSIKSTKLLQEKILQLNIFG